MAIWAKNTTRCRICGKKTAKDRLVCVGTGFSDWFVHKTGANPGSSREIDIRHNLYYVNSTDPWYYQPNGGKAWRDKALDYFKNFGIDFTTTLPLPMYGENTECLRKLAIWATSNRKPFVPDTGQYSDSLAVLLDEYLEAH